MVDLVLNGIRGNSLTELPPFEYSWGVKHWGMMNEELARASVGLVVLSIGHLILLPPLIMKSTRIRKAGVIVAMVLIGFSALFFVLAPFSIMQAVGVIPATSAVDPGSSRIWRKHECANESAITNHIANR